VAVGQIIGLIEAMKLFNEIKSDLARARRRVCAESGARVKAKQPLIEVEPGMDGTRDRSAASRGGGRYAPSQVLTNADPGAHGSTHRRVDRQPDRDPRAAASPPPRVHGLDGRGRRAAAHPHGGPPAPNDIDVIILATLTPDYWMPFTGALGEGGDRQ
jgi:hypothetical protein